MAEEAAGAGETKQQQLFLENLGLESGWGSISLPKPTLWGFIFRWMVWRENRCS